MEPNRANGSRRCVEKEMDKKNKDTTGRVMQCVA